MPVVTTRFEFFLLCYSGRTVLSWFRTVQSGCFAHHWGRVTPPLLTRCTRFIRFLDRNAVPTGRNAGSRCCLGCYCMPHLRTAVWHVVCAVVLLCCVPVYVCMLCCVCVCFVPLCRYFGNLFGMFDKKVKVYAGHLRCHFLDFFGASML